MIPRTVKSQDEKDAAVARAITPLCDAIGAIGAFPEEFFGQRFLTAAPAMQDGDTMRVSLHRLKIRGDYERMRSFCLPGVTLRARYNDAADGPRRPVRDFLCNIVPGGDPYFQRSPVHIHILHERLTRVNAAKLTITPHESVTTPLRALDVIAGFAAAHTSFRHGELARIVAIARTRLMENHQSLKP